METDAGRMDHAVAVFTSGGDAPGMNAVVRSVVRCGIHHARDVFAVYEGYQGLVDGAGKIRKMEWTDVQMMIYKGGTVIGSARCKEFREREGRLAACKHLVDRGITNIICCGGDGSLTGANIFKLEWASLLEELRSSGRVTDAQAQKYANINIIGCVGSIDNDMVYDGTLTIGTDTALHRIVDAIDAVQSTASSHQRTFVLEIMGRHCGYLAWAAGVATGADYIFIPEAPSKHDDWESVLCAKLDHQRKRGARLCTVLVAEGAIDKFGKPIKTEYVRQVIIDRLGHDTRSTILGHVQRGGYASAYDRFLGSVSGALAVERLLRTKPEDASTIVGVKGYSVAFNPLVETIEATQMVAKHTEQLDFEAAIQARGKDFKRHWAIQKSINRDFAKREAVPDAGKNICIICSGAPAGGVNAAVRSANHYALNLGYAVYAAYDGFQGFLEGNIKPLAWEDVLGWAGDGGCNLRCDRSVPSDPDAMNEICKQFKLDALLVIGGFDGLKGIYHMRDEVTVPVAYVPATISNNVPGTDFSIGSDTALNAIVSAIDTCKKSADASKSRVFIIEVQGRNSGYLTVLSALASGADIAYTPEKGVTLEQMQADIEEIKSHIKKHNKRHFVVVRNEFCSPAYDLNFMETLFREEGKGCFSVRTVKLGHLCQGDYPSPLDRIRATTLAATATEHLIKCIKGEETENKKVLVGFSESKDVVRTMEEACQDADWTRRVPASEPWAWLLNLQQCLSGFMDQVDDNQEYDATAGKLVTNVLLNGAPTTIKKVLLQPEEQDQGTQA
ncbi:ATP-dependent 6-phosphofructokinase [Hondaea fermentalgiana]|uniref:6-phosphofructokinase n=1 Tax=Hondaea fermentalgiana TaxID=2315210 RepID=A0A2R5GJG5_9STRA|nr:ATP-dependent 6-phosphofructokinase [Hondaea fermentalgiana]|eukprot:GBG29878.1 ATP-dependent 6-phosphofructokinase [Hondaea fermentalgiana]